MGELGESSLQAAPAINQSTAPGVTEPERHAGHLAGEFHANAHEPDELHSRNPVSKHPGEAPICLSSLDQDKLQGLLLSLAQTSDRVEGQPNGVDHSVHSAQAIAVTLFERRG